MDLVVLKNVQTGLTDTIVKTTVALIARSLEYVTGKQEIASVKWDGNQKSVTQSALVIRLVRIVQSRVDIALIMNSAIMLTAIVQMDVIWDFMESIVRMNVPGDGTVITVTRHAHTLVSQISPVTHAQETALGYNLSVIQTRRRQTPLRSLLGL